MKFTSTALKPEKKQEEEVKVSKPQKAENNAKAKKQITPPKKSAKTPVPKPIEKKSTSAAEKPVKQKKNNEPAVASDDVTKPQGVPIKMNKMNSDVPGKKKSKKALNI